MWWHRASRLFLSPPARRLAWVLFAIAFYLSGESAVIWLLQPAQIDGPWRWLGVALFPILLPAFFMLQRFFGCSGSRCTPPVDNGPPSRAAQLHYPPPPPPG